MKKCVTISAKKKGAVPRFSSKNVRQNHRLVGTISNHDFDTMVPHSLHDHIIRIEKDSPDFFCVLWRVGIVMREQNHIFHNL